MKAQCTHAVQVFKCVFLFWEGGADFPHISQRVRYVHRTPETFKVNPDFQHSHCRSAARQRETKTHTRARREDKVDQTTEAEMLQTSPAGPAVTVSLRQHRGCDLIHTDTTWTHDTFITRMAAARACACLCVSYS